MYKKSVKKLYCSEIKNKFHRFQNQFFLKHVHIDNKLMSKKIFSDEKNIKFFIGHMDDDNKIKPLYIMLPKTNAYVSSFDSETK